MTPAIVPPARFSTPVVIHDSPFKARSQVMLAPEGATLADMVRMAGFVGKRIMPHVHVYVDDLEVPQDRWHRVRPKEGRSVYIQVRLHGGGGGDGEDKNPLRVILMLAVVVLALWAGPAAAGALGIKAGTLLATTVSAAVSAAVATAGFFLVDAIVPPPRPPGAQYGWGQQDGNPYAMLTGIRNQFAPYAPIPRVLGKRRMFPLLAARPYTENLSGKQYLRMLLLVGYGRLRITDLRIGDTPISAFPGAAIEIREGTLSDSPVTLFTRVVREDGLTIKLQRTEDTASGGAPPGGWAPGFDVWWTYNPSAPDVPRTDPVLVDPTTYTFSDPGGWITRTSRSNTSEISLDMSAPRGMFRANAQGRRYETYVDVQVQYRAAGTSGSWLTPTWLEPNAALGTGTNGTLRVQALSADPIVRSARFSTGSNGQWDVRVKHNGPARGSDPTYVDDVYWTALRSISTDTPVTMPGLSLIALRLEASEQLNGAPDTINCLAESYIPTFDGTSWDDANPVITSNPAWHYAHVMRWRGQNRVIPDARIDAVGIKAWADACAVTAPNASEPRWTYDNVLEGGSIYTALQDIAGHGRASFTIIDGKYSVVRDVEQTVPVQVITTRNSWGYEGRKAFVDIPHAFRCTFSNKDKNNEPDEVIVYRDGYAKEAATGILAATKFELLSFPGATSSTQAWREGRYHLATLLLRPEEHSISMDIEHLRCTKGDLVRLEYDVIKVGLGSGRISGRTVGGSNVTHFDLDSPVTMETGETYALRVRKRNGSVVLLPIVTVNGFQETVELVTPIASSTAPDVGDLYAFGESGIETAPMIVKSIDPGEDLTARLTLVDAQAGVWSADTGTIPAFNTFISGRRHVQDAPAIPSISLTSSEAALLRLADGTLQERLMVRVIPRGNDQIAVARFEVQFRNAGGGDWTPAAQATPEAPVVYITNVTQGEAYDVRVRAWSNGGTPSAWASATSHTIIGKTTRPANVTGLAVTRRIDGVVLTFTAVSDIDLWAYEVRRGGTGWADAAHVGYFTATTIGLQETLSGDTVYRVKAIDVIGLDSVTAASVTASATLPAFPGEAAAVPWSGVTGSGKPADNATVGAIIGTNLRRDDATVPILSAIETSLGTAAGIAGQGWGATASEAAASNARAAIGGGNALANSEFAGSSYPPFGWVGGGWVGGGPGTTGGSFTGSIISVSGGRAVQVVIGGSPTSGTFFDLLYGPYGDPAALRRHALVVAPGDTVCAQAKLSKNASCSQVNTAIYWKDSSGSYIGESHSAAVTATDTYTDAHVIAVAPAGAAFASLFVRAIPNGGATPTARFMHPMISRVPANQVTPPPYSPSPFDRSADVTASNTAAAISGQGALATRSDVDLAGSTTIGDLTSGRVRNSGTALSDRWPAEAGANVTESRTAAAIAGQGALATLSSVGASRTNLPALDQVIPDSDMRDSAWWGLGGLGSFIDLDGGWTYRRAISFGNGSFDYSSSYFPVQPGALYRIRCRIWNNAGGWSGTFWPLIHMPSVAWYSLKHGYAVGPDVANADNAIVAAGDTGDVNWYFTNPTGITNNVNRQWQFRFKGASIAGGPVVVAVEITRVYRLNELVARETGALLTDNTAVTSLGTAAAISGQGALATRSTANLGASGQVRREDGSTAITDALAITSLGTAAAIAGQGWGATASEAAASNAQVPVGSNSLVNSEFARNTYAWTPLWNGSTGAGVTQSIEGAERRALRAAAIGSWSNGQAFEIGAGGPDSRFWLPVKQGDRVFASALLAYNSACSNAQVNIHLYDANGTYQGEVGTNGGAANGAPGNNPANYTRVTHFQDIGANVAFAALRLRVGTNGGASPVAWAMEPMLCIVPSGQTAAPVYVAGRADVNADQTSANTAAAISGQGPWATTGTALATVLAPNPNLFAFPSPIQGGVWGGSTPTPASYGWQGNTLNVGYWQPSGGDLYFRARPSGGADVLEYYWYDIPNAVAGQLYTVSLWGYATGAFNPYIECLDGSKAWLSVSYLSLDAASGRWRTTFTAPANTAFLRIVISANFPASGSYQDVVFNRIKVEHGSQMTPLGSLSPITPRQSGADVTGSNTAAAIVGQGWGATASEAQIRAQQLFATASAKAVAGSRLTAGSVTTATVTITATGGSGGYSYSWARISGHSSTATASTSATTAFTGEAGPEPPSATWECTVTDSGGRAVSVIVGAGFVLAV